MSDHVDVSELHSRILSYDAGAFPIINGKLSRDYPKEHKKGSHHNVRIDYKGENSWAVTYARMCLGVDGDGKLDWAYEAIPSELEDDFLRRYRFESPEKALEAFNKWSAYALAEWAATHPQTT